MFVLYFACIFYEFLEIFRLSGKTKLCCPRVYEMEWGDTVFIHPFGEKIRVPLLCLHLSRKMKRTLLLSSYLCNSSETTSGEMEMAMVNGLSFGIRYLFRVCGSCCYTMSYTRNNLWIYFKGKNREHYFVNLNHEEIEMLK